ncbi:hypothetical protein CFC21_030401 [Triticum aestivum]|uniref:Uncharacterized protein n=3 Tax=Triticinae TaxID=1648030 RepID=A0A453C618_AEGTS|nr:uncharacterized protein LOC109734200 [Aegilops tauschii subsp. strangulata]XP_044332991.1 uncharacterized protein LOC123053583 [Triticum aestivum]KAF7016881.1 hypothetical protein CFC21_030401 [Triticum aestivum]
MSCTRISGAVLVFALLFAPLLLTLCLPLACARHVVALEAKDGLNIGGGRQQVVGDDAGKAVPVSNAGGSRPVRTVELPAARRHRVDAAEELHDMLRRDYAWRARRRKPIHNDEPRDDEP